MSSEFRPQSSRWLPLALLLALAALTWWPLLISRPAVADDYLIGPIVGKGLGEYWRIYGIWRLAGHPIPFLLKQLVVHGDAVAALLVHLASVTLIYQLLRKLITSESLQIAAALVFAVMPFGFQALAWNSALSFALSTAFALGALLVSLKPFRSTKDELRTATLVSLLGLLSISANEASLLLVAWIALYQMVLAGCPRPDRARWLIALSLLASEAAWVVVHLATRQAYFHKHVAFHVLTIFSGLVRQYEQLSYFIHLPRLGVWITPGCWISAVGSALLIFGLWSRRQAVQARISRAQILAFAVLPLAAVTVYALGGGFSLDSRKAYPIWAFLLLSGAWFLQATPPVVQRFVFCLSLDTAPLLVFSSQVTMRVWQQTASIFEKAGDQINAQHLPGPYAFHWQPDAYVAWPDFERLCGFRFDDRWMLDYPIMEGALRPGPAQTTLVWRSATGTWEVASH